MNTKLIKLLLVLCILLLAVIAGEWFYAKHLQKQTLAALKVVDKKTPKIAQMPSIALTQKPEQSFVDLVDRPLFIKGRRPVPELPVDQKQAVIKPTGPFNWQLNGVYSKNAKLYALLSRSVRLPKGNFRKLTQGADIDGWKLTEVQKDKVVLNQGSLQKELLLRKAKSKKLPNPGATQNVPKTPAEQEQAMAEQAARQQQMMRPPNQSMAEPLPNGDSMPEQMPEGVPDPGFPQAEGSPEAEPMPDPESEIMPEEPMPDPESGVMPEEPMPDAEAQF